MNELNNMIDVHEDFKWVEVLKKCEISLHDDIPPPPPVMQVDIKREYNVTIMTRGNISVIKGQAKSRKSFAVTMMAAEVIKLIRKGTFTSPQRMKIAYFDTEQSTFYVHRIIQRVAKIAGEEFLKDGFSCFSLRHMNTMQRRKMIEIAFHFFKGYDIFILDGVRDLMMDINSQNESTELVNDLMKWTGESNIHLITVLHENPSNEGGGKMRGHIGTELMNKAETVLEVIKEKEHSLIKPFMVRGLDFDPIAFYIEDGIPKVNNNWTPPEF